MLTHKGTQPLETSRLLLRRPTVEDAESMYKNWASDPAVTKFLTWKPHDNSALTRALLAMWSEECEKSDCYQWLIVPKGLAEPIGSIAVVCTKESTDAFEIGYCIGVPWWHKGIMSEAFSAVIDYLFREVGANRICAEHDTNNPHSGDVMRKCGLSYEGTMRSAGRNTQGICDLAVYAILRSDWENTRM